MTKPHLILFRPEEQDTASILQLIGRREIELRTVLDIEEAKELCESGFPLDVIILPPRLRGGKSLLGTCLQIKSEELMALAPVVALLASKDKAVLESLFGAGADCCFHPPYEPDIIHLQIGAFARQRRLLSDQLEVTEYATLLKGPVAELLHELSHAVIFFSTEGEVIFANRSAYQILGAPESLGAQSLQFMWADLLPLIPAPTKVKNKPSASRELWSNRAISIPHRSGSRIEVVSTAQALQKGEKTAGYLLSFSRSSDITRLQFSLSTLFQIYPLAFQGFASTLFMLRKAFPSLPLRYQDRAQEMLEANEQLNAPVGQVVQALLETLDGIVTATAEVKVTLNLDREVKVRSGDLFQILALITSHAVLLAGPQGETLISGELSDDEHFLVLVVATEFQEVRSSHEAFGLFLRLLQGSNETSNSDQEEHSPPTLLSRAQEIADRYRLRLELKEGSTFIKIRLKLPLVTPGA